MSRQNSENSHPHSANWFFTSTCIYFRFLYLLWYSFKKGIPLFVGYARELEAPLASHGRKRSFLRFISWHLGFILLYLYGKRFADHPRCPFSGTIVISSQQSFLHQQDQSKEGCSWFRNGSFSFFQISQMVDHYLLMGRKFLILVG